MTSKPEDKHFELGHYAIMRRAGEVHVGEIVACTSSLVKIKAPYGNLISWRKVDLIGVVPPEALEQVETNLDAVENEYRRRLREAAVLRQSGTKDAIKGFEAWSLL